MYAEEEFSVFASNLGLDTACMSGIIKIMEYVDFCNYGKDFLMGKIDDNRYYRNYKRKPTALAVG